MQRDPALKAFVDQWLHIVRRGRQLHARSMPPGLNKIGFLRNCRICRPQLDSAKRVEPKPPIHDLYSESDAGHVARDCRSVGSGLRIPPAQEVMMKKLFAFAAFLLASTAAQAQYTFEYGGRTIRIDPDRGTVSIPGVYDNSGRRTKRSHNDQDSDRPRKQTPQQAKIDPQAPDCGTCARPNRRPRPRIHRPSLQPPQRTLRRRIPRLRRSLQPARRAPQVRQDAAPLAKPAPARNGCDDRAGAKTPGASRFSQPTRRSACG